MKLVKFDQAQKYEPQKGWKRVSLAGNESFSFEWFEKPPGHSSPTHSHKNDQVSIVLKGKLKIYSEDKEFILEKYDSVLIEAEEKHRIENPDPQTVVGLDVFSPCRPFDFWDKELK